jgi:hypothetical protein
VLLVEGAHPLSDRLRGLTRGIIRCGGGW